MEKLSSDEVLKEMGGFEKIPHISSMGDCQAVVLEVMVCGVR